MYHFETHPHIQPAPAPWTLNGAGYILIFRFPSLLLDRHRPAGPNHLGQPRLNIGCVMLVDYAASAVGPYRELLFMPGLFKRGRHFHLSITRIYVSTWNSIVNGHVNWGIPKEHADFQVCQEDDGSERITVSRQGAAFVQLHLRPWGMHLPMNTAWVPAALRTVLQAYQGKIYSTSLSGKGRLRPARLLSAEIDDVHFPDFSGCRLLAAVKVNDFVVNFPIPAIEPLPNDLM